MLGNFWSETLRLLSAESIHWVMIKLVWRIPAVLIQFRNTSPSCIHLSIQLSISTSHFCRCSWLDHDDRLISGGIPSLHMKCFSPLCSKHSSHSDTHPAGLCLLNTPFFFSILIPLSLSLSLDLPLFPVIKLSPSSSLQGYEVVPETRHTTLTVVPSVHLCPQHVCVCVCFDRDSSETPVLSRVTGGKDRAKKQRRNLGETIRRREGSWWIEK